MKRYSWQIWLLAGLCLALLTACGTATTATPAASTAPAASAASAAASSSPTSGKAITVREAWARPAMAGGAAMGTPGAGMGGMATPAASMGGMAPPSGSPMAGGSPMAMSGNISAAYMTIANSGSSADKLVSAASTVAGAIELHTTVVQDNVAKMQQVEGIDVPAGGEVQLKPGGYHIMLINVTRDLKAGDTFTLTLTFAQAGKVDVTVQVRQP